MKPVYPGGWEDLMLERDFPGQGPFYYRYVEGGYLNQDYTIYYNAAKVELREVCHGNYS